MAEKGEKRDPSSHRTPTQITRQVNGRNKTKSQKEYRAELGRENYRRQKAGTARVGDNLDVAHKTARRHGGKATAKNTRLLAESTNRADNGSRGSVTRRVRRQTA